MVHEVNACRRGLVAQDESGVRGVGRRAIRSTIQSHREQDRSEKGHADNRAADGGAGTAEHESEYNVRPSRQRQLGQR